MGRMVKDFDKEDPFEMNAIEIPGGDISLQAQIMAEEFRDMGIAIEELKKMFADPFYGGLHMAYIQLGEKNVNKIIGQAYKKVLVRNG